MNYYLFPFHAIDKGSNIVLYAAGAVGKDYYRQLQDTGFCNVILWLDQNPKSKDVKTPEIIQNISADDYEYVIVAVKDKIVAEKIRFILLQYGVAKPKIFYQEPILSASKSMQAESELGLDDYFNSTSVVKNALLDYFYKSDGDVAYFSKLINEIKLVEDHSIRELILSRALAFANDSSISIELLIVLLRVLFDSECFSAELMRQFVRLIGEFKGNPSQKYWLLLDLSYMWLFYPHTLYDEFFVDKKNIMRDYAEELRLYWAKSEGQSNNSRTICILIHNLFIGSRSDCVTQYVSPVVRELVNRGYIIHMIDLSPQKWDSGASFLKPLYRDRQSSSFSRESLLNYYPDNVHLYQTSAPTMRDRQQEILDQINEICPYCIIDATDDCSAISCFYNKNFPTIYMPFRSPCCSSSYFHRIIFSNNVDVVPPVCSEQVLILPFNFEQKHPQKNFKREDYGFANDDIIVVTVSNRLQYDLNNSLIELFCSSLIIESNIKWLCVGGGDLPYLEEHFPHSLGKQVFLWGYEQDLPGLFTISDIYLNPSRVGGGTTIAWAIQQGVAVVSPLDAEAGVLLLGENNSVKTEAELITQIVAMAHSRELLKERKNKMLELSSKWSVEAYVDGLIDGMDSLVEEFMKVQKTK